jgi:hypothetical protein
MRRFIISLIAASALGLASWYLLHSAPETNQVAAVLRKLAKTPPNLPDQPDEWRGRIDYGKLNQQFSALTRRSEMAGLAVAIVEDGELRFVHSYGVVDRSTNVPVTNNTVFRWASVSKTVAGTLAASMASEAACGSKWRESAVRYDRASSSWKTHRCLWEEVLPWSSVTLPKWGMMRSGELWERITPPLLTNEKESGSWLPTPLSTLGSNGGPNARDSSGRPGLQMAAMTWPTPRACMTGGATPERLNDKNRNLEKAVAATMFATPQAQDFRTGQQSRWENPERTRNLNDQIGGQLNPTWVEWLMGWPLGWTDCAASATAKFREWCRSHGIS